jgi:hypothetical protein
MLLELLADPTLATLASPPSSIMQTLVSLTETSNPIAHAALLLLMLEAAGADLVSPPA